MTIWIVSAILILTLYLLISEKLPVDLTAIGIMVMLMISRVLTPIEAVAGFAHPAVITVGSMFLVSKGMVRTGAVGYIGQKVIAIARGNAKLAVLVILLTVAVASAFINNTPVVVLFIPVVMRMCCQFGLSPSKILIPLSYTSILAGTCTLIGTSTNIIISDLSANNGYGAIAMFEFSMLGLPIAAIGIAFLLVAAPRFMPELLNPTCELENSEHRRYLAEFAIPRGSALIDQDPATVFAKQYPNLEVLELIRYSHIFHPSRDAVTIALGTAMKKTGTSQLYADAYLEIFSGFPPVVVLGGFILLASISTHILSNNATAVLLFPIAISTAIGIGVDPRPFVMAVCFGASACFATPIGYQTNLLVYEPGGYRFTDYLKLGIPLNLLVLILGSAFIPILWPF